MAKEFTRLQRVSQELQKKIAVIIQSDINDPRLKGLIITVSSIEISKDLAYAKIFVTLFKNTKDIEINKIVNILQKSSEYIRYLLSKSIYLRIIPKLTFLYDKSLIEGIRISKIISVSVKN